MEDAYDFDIDELRPEPPGVSQDCVSCGREWFGPQADECRECRSAGGRPVPCLQCSGEMRWVYDRTTRAASAECQKCDAQYPLAAVRTHRLGQLVERLVEESVSGSAEEVGRMILAAGRTSLRRVQ